MKIKHSNFERTPLSRFDLLGKDENALSKAFTYVIASHRGAFFEFLKLLDISTKNTINHFKQTEISVETKRKEGRTDIEIRLNKRFHLIIEAKIKNNRVLAQRYQYMTAFGPEPQQVMCFITQINDFQKSKDKQVRFVNISWMEISRLFDKKAFQKDPIIQEFLRYIQKGYKMREQKEILIQDVSKPKEIRRFREHHIYRRPITFGSPLYFSPYFTRGAKQLEGEGISYLSKILGIITLKPQDIANYRDDLLSFTESYSLVNAWIQGVKFDGRTKKLHTYYFLNAPIRLKRPLRKDGTIKKGRGKGWIAAQIPPNRCVTFEEFMKRAQ